MMKHRFREQWMPALVFFILGLIGGITPSCQLLAFTPSKTIPSDVTSDFQLMAEAWNTIQRFYVDRKAVNPTQMIYGAVSGKFDTAFCPVL